jgi:hypothetical protein
MADGVGLVPLLIGQIVNPAELSDFSVSVDKRPFQLKRRRGALRSRH